MQQEIDLPPAGNGPSVPGENAASETPFDAPADQAWPCSGGGDAGAEASSSGAMAPCAMGGGIVFQDDDFFTGLSPSHRSQWSVVWSDLMMTMFVLFAVLYIFQVGRQQLFGGSQPVVDRGFSGEAMARGGNTDGAGSGNNPASDGNLLADDATMNAVYDLSREAMADYDLNDIASVNLAPDRTVRIVLTGDLLFDTGRIELKPGARQSLARIAGVLRLNPYIVNVVGHTDNVPVHSERYPTNWELSVLRAAAVVRYLIEEQGLAGERFYVSGHSRHRPVRSNALDEGRAANRRVELIVTRELPAAFRQL